MCSMHTFEATGNGASIRKVVAMTLRTAQSDIDRAISNGIPYLLYKPFSKEEVLDVADHVVSQQKEDSKKGQRFLTSKGKVRILECPGEKSSRFRSIAGSLLSDMCTSLMTWRKKV